MPIEDISIIERFRTQVESVDRLVNFDTDVLGFAIEEIEKLRDRLVAHHHLDNPSLTDPPQQTWTPC